MKMEILAEFPVPSDQTIIIKGKRTKRPRPSSSADDSHNSPVYSSPATSSASTEEDEDMANCLILLARGNTPPPQNKNSTRKFTEMATTTAARVGIYVYECKTCSRTFPSFQALGGHRASHKRPKLAADTIDREVADEKQLGNCKLNCTVTPLPPKSPPLPSKITDQSKLPKIHECSICGSEFASGQALGGHMRRHRAAAPISVDKPRNVLALDLDLNLPAPVEVDDKYNQQPRIVFSAAALVDCHY